MAGKFHVLVSLRVHGKPVAEARFDICIGADPEGDPAALAATCPRLNPGMPERKHEH